MEPGHDPDATAPVEILIPCRFCGKDIADWCYTIRLGVDAATGIEILAPMQPVRCPHCKHAFANVKPMSSVIPVTPGAMGLGDLKGKGM